MRNCLSVLVLAGIELDFLIVTCMGLFCICAENSIDRLILVINLVIGEWSLFSIKTRALHDGGGSCTFSVKAAWLGSMPAYNHTQHGKQTGEAEGLSRAAEL